MSNLSSVQPSIPRANSPAPIAWSDLDPRERAQIMADTQMRTRKRFKARLRHKICYGTWEQLGKSTQAQIYATDWRKALQSLRELESRVINLEDVLTEETFERQPLPAVIKGRPIRVRA